MILVFVLTVSLFSVAEGQDLSQISCQVCEESIDHVGNFLGGNPGCYNMTENFFQACPSGFNLCATKMSVDWFSAGDQEIKFTRMCSDKNVEFGQECIQGGNLVGLFKDCETSCNTPNCNDGNDVELLYSDRDENGDPRDLHCYEFDMDKLSESGLSSYEDNNIPNSDWYVRKCPRWANQGCFRADQIWQEGFETNNTFNKGCSMFSLNEQENTCDNTGASNVCKSFCRGSFCNKGGLNDGNEPRPPIKCHQCMEIRDHMGERVPNQNHNDENCYELVDDQFLDFCRGDQTQCITTLRTDWFAFGYQILFFSRNCSESIEIQAEGLENGECDAAQAGNTIYKDCNITCSGVGCNNNNDVELLFSDLDENGESVEISCYAYRQETDEKVHNTTTYPDKDDFSMNCPRFANQGCFKSEYTVNPDFPIPGIRNSFNKGCSMYELGNVEPDCRDLNLLGGMCREHCSGTNCNIGFIGDRLPEVTTTQTSAQPTKQTSPEPTTRTTITTTKSTRATSTAPKTEDSAATTSSSTVASTTAPISSPTSLTTTSKSVLPTNPTPVPDEPVDDNANLIFFSVELIFLVLILL